jgi:hypothetical protein
VEKQKQSQVPEYQSVTLEKNTEKSRKKQTKRGGKEKIERRKKTKTKRKRKKSQNIFQDP